MIYTLSMYLSIYLSIYLSMCSSDLWLFRQPVPFCVNSPLLDDSVAYRCCCYCCCCSQAEPKKLQVSEFEIWHCKAMQKPLRIVPTIQEDKQVEFDTSKTLPLQR